MCSEPKVTCLSWCIHHMFNVGVVIVDIYVRVPTLMSSYNRHVCVFVDVSVLYVSYDINILTHVLLCLHAYVWFIAHMFLSCTHLCVDQRVCHFEDTHMYHFAHMRLIAVHICTCVIACITFTPPSMSICRWGCCSFLRIHQYIDVCVVFKTRIRVYLCTLVFYLFPLGKICT